MGPISVPEGDRWRFLCKRPQQRPAAPVLERLGVFVGEVRSGQPKTMQAHGPRRTFTPTRSIGLVIMTCARHAEVLQFNLGRSGTYKAAQIRSHHDFKASASVALRWSTRLVGSIPATGSLSFSTLSTTPTSGSQGARSEVENHQCPQSDAV